MKRTGLTMLECGHCRHPEAMTMKGASWGVVDFPSLVGLIRHPTEGVILFDTGYSRRFLEATRPFPERLYRWTTPVSIRAGESAVERLEHLGINRSDVRHIIISHFHGDHVAGLLDFPHARMHCARAGVDHVRTNGRISRVRQGLLDALLPDGMEDAEFFEDGRQVDLPSDFAPFASGADVLGDGSLVAVPLPGHCPGHWGLALRLEDDRRVMLVADAAWSLKAIERNAPPPALTARMLGDARRHRETLAMLNGMTGREGLVLLPSHCRDAATRSELMA